MTLRWLVQGASLSACVLAATWSHAYCRTTTCDPTEIGSCSFEGECTTGGEYLAWWSGCVSYGVQRDGSPLRGIDLATAEAQVHTAFVHWQSAECGTGRPSTVLKLNDSPILCTQAEYNQSGGNANTWLFRDTDWPYDGVNNTLALTTVTFNVATGEIFDADVEINSFMNHLGLAVTDPGSHLGSILTHEAGHFLGLSHSPLLDATMYATYQKRQSSLDSLAQDDIDGICSIYPPETPRDTCDFTPRHGFSAMCGGNELKQGCVASIAGAPSPGSSLCLAALGALGLLASRIRSRRATRGPCAAAADCTRRAG